MVSPGCPGTCNKKGVTPLKTGEEMVEVIVERIHEETSLSILFR